MKLDCWRSSDRCHFRDLHATILSAMGLHHEELFFEVNGRQERLTGVASSRKGYPGNLWLTMHNVTREDRLKNEGMLPGTEGSVWPLLMSIVLFAAILASAQAEDRIATDGKPSLAEEANVLLRERCVNCHGGDKADGNLRLDSRVALLKGGDRGPAFRPDNFAESLVLRSINGVDVDLQMPPKQPLSKEEIALVERWFKVGAPWRNGHCRLLELRAIASVPHGLIRATQL